MSFPVIDSIYKIVPPVLLLLFFANLIAFLRSILEAVKLGNRIVFPLSYLPANFTSFRPLKTLFPTTFLSIF